MVIRLTFETSEDYGLTIRSEVWILIYLLMTSFLEMRKTLWDRNKLTETAPYAMSQANHSSRSTVWR